MRSARSQQISYREPGDEPEDEEAEDSREDEEEDEPMTTRTKRIVIKPERFAESDVYDQKPRRTSLENRGNVGAGGRRTSRSHPQPEYEEEKPEKPQPRRAFPPRSAAPANASLDNLFDNDGDDDGPPPPTESQETATPTPRKGGRRGRSRHSSEGSFNPDESDAQSEHSESDDPIAGDFIHHDDDEEDEEDEDADYGYNRRPKRQAARGPQRRATKTSARTRMSTRTRGRAAEEEEDDAPFGGKRLRERKSTVNYALPPADLSAEILQEAIASASRPNGRAGVGRAGGVRFAGAAGAKGLPWSARGRDLAQAMGDPDTSDSVCQIPNLTGSVHLADDQDDLMPPMKGGGGPSAVPAGGAGRGGPTDVPNFGRINPKSCEQHLSGIVSELIGGSDGRCRPAGSRHECIVRQCWWSR